MCNYLVMDCFGSLLQNGRGVASDAKYLIGLGSYDITRLGADVNTMGCANTEQITSGVHFRLLPRTFIVAKPQGKQMVFVNLGACMASQLATMKVIELNYTRFGKPYDESQRFRDGVYNLVLMELTERER